MVFQCNHCGGRVKFDINKQHLRCDSCDRLVVDVEEKVTEYWFDQYVCSSCGAKLNVNEEEVTSKCPYCQAQDIFFKGKCNDYPIEYIVPFRVDYENAINLIRQEFEGYRLAPGKIRKFSVEAVKPLYVPFWAYDVRIKTRQIIEGGKGGTFGELEKWLHTRRVEVVYEDVEVDASKNLVDGLAERLGPWHFDEKKEFSPKYMAGFFGGVAEYSDEDLSERVKARAEIYVDELVMKSCSTTKDNKVKERKYLTDIVDKHLMLLPIWFFTSTYRGKKFSAIINGQTGKVVSAVPHFKSTLIGFSLGATAVFAVPLYYLVQYINDLMQVNRVGGLVSSVVGIGVVAWLFFKSSKKYGHYMKTLREFYMDSMISFAEKEKEKDEA